MESSRNSEKSEKRRKSRSRKMAPKSKSDQRPRCFKDIVDLVLHLSYDEWKGLTREMSRKVSRLEFAAAASKTVIKVSTTIIHHLLKPLSELYGIGAIVEANHKLKEMIESHSSKSASHTSGQRAPTMISNFICDLAERIITEVKSAMLESISTTALDLCSGSTSSSLSSRKSQLGDFSIACTDEICESILALYETEELKRSKELERSGRVTSEMSLKSHQGIHGIMKGLREVVSSSRSPVSSKVASISYSDRTKVTPDSALSAALSENIFSDHCMDIALEMITEILLETERKLTASVSATSEGDSSFLMELARSTAMDILGKLYGVLVRCIEADNEQTFLSLAQQIHTDIHRRVSLFIREQQREVSKKNKTFVDACTETDAKLNASSENFQTSGVAAKFMDDATELVSDILVKRLTSLISSDLISRKGSSTAPSSSSWIDLNSVVSGSMNQMNGIIDLKNLSDSWLGEASVSYADRFSGPYSMGSLASSSRLQSLSGPEDIVLEAEREPLPSGQKSRYVPLHILTVVCDQLKSFFTSFCKCAAADKVTNPSAHSEREEDCVDPIVSGEECLVHKLDMHSSLSDSVLVKRSRPVQFPSLLLYRFAEETTRNLLQNVLSDWDIDKVDVPSPHTNQDREKKRRPRARFVLKSYRRVVVKRPKRRPRKLRKQKKQHRVPLPQKDQPSTSPSTCPHEDSDRESKPSRSIFKNTRKTLGRIVSSISKAFSGIFKRKKNAPETPPNRSVSKQNKRNK